MPPQRRAFYCLVCRQRRQGRYDTLAAWKERVDDRLFAAGKGEAPGYLRAVCEPCARKLRAPYLVHAPPGAALRAVRRPSLLFTSNDRGKRVQGLIAVDPVPAGALLPYPGPLVDEHALAALRRQHGYELTHAYAKNGPKDLGVKALLMGHLAPSVRTNPYCAAHRINARRSAAAGGANAHVKPNCRWAHVVTDEAFYERHPEVDRGRIPLGTRYPAVRTARALRPGDEFVLNTYGDGYWARSQREAEEGAASLPFLRPHERALLAALAPGATLTRDKRTRAPVKRL